MVFKAVEQLMMEMDLLLMTRQQEIQQLIEAGVHFVEPQIVEDKNV